MKKTLTSIAFSLLAFAGAEAQMQLSSDQNTYVIGDSQRFIMAMPADEGQAGAGVVWDFSGLQPKGELTSYMIDAREVDKNNTFPECNVLLREDHKMFMFRVSNQSMDEFGEYRDDQPFKYDEPIVKFTFPFSYGSYLKGHYKGAVVSKPEVRLEGDYSTEADGYGTLVLPGNVVFKDVLRVRFERTMINGGCGVVTYRWYARNANPIIRYPILTISRRYGCGNNEVYQVAYYADLDKVAQAQDSPAVTGSTSGQTFENSIQLKASPNPFSNETELVYELPTASKVTLFISDNQGRILNTLVNGQQMPGTQKVKTGSNLSKASYFATLVVNGQIVSNCTLIKQ